MNDSKFNHIWEFEWHSLEYFPCGNRCHRCFMSYLQVFHVMYEPYVLTLVDSPFQPKNDDFSQTIKRISIKNDQKSFQATVMNETINWERIFFSFPPKNVRFMPTRLKFQCFIHTGSHIELGQSFKPNCIQSTRNKSDAWRSTSHPLFRPLAGLIRKLSISLASIECMLNSSWLIKSY